MTTYALTASQFDTFILNGGTEAFLDTLGNYTYKVVDTSDTAGTDDFATGNFLNMVSVTGVGKFDEIRYGSTLADVTPTSIPEPTILGLTVAACGVILVWNRQRKQSI